MPLLVFSDAEVDRYLHVVRSAGAGELLAGAMRKDKRGRKPGMTAEQYLLGGLLTLAGRKPVSNTNIHEILTRSISPTKREELGIEPDFPASRVHSFSRRVDKMLGTAYVDDAEAAARTQARNAVMDALLDGSLASDGDGWYALDGTGWWAHGKGRARDDDATADVRADEDVAEVSRTVRDRGLTPSGRKRRDCDDEATWGTKTSKSGGREPFYGYMVDVAVRVPDRKGGGPLLAERVRVSPANTDVVAPTLDILDGITAKGSPVTDILVDRHYSYKREDRWAAELRARGITQHFDLRSNEQGFTQHDQTRIVAGWVHCPATPDELADIPHPGPNASRDKHEEFQRKINLRFAYALDRKERTNTDGRSRWICPALRGKAGCPLRAGTVAEAMDQGLPIVANPPAPEVAPDCCTKASIAVVNERLRKHEQRHYWGTESWTRTYNRRTYVEGYFGSLKSRHTEDFSREITGLMGLAIRSLIASMAFAVTNIRHQRKFHGDQEHPLLKPGDDSDYVIVIADTPTTPTPVSEKNVGQLGHRRGTT